MAPLPGFPKQELQVATILIVVTRVATVMKTASVDVDQPSRDIGVSMSIGSSAGPQGRSRGPASSSSRAASLRVPRIGETVGTVAPPAAERGRRSKIGAASRSPEIELSLHMVMPRVGTCEKHKRTAMHEMSMPSSNRLGGDVGSRVGKNARKCSPLAYFGPLWPQHMRVYQQQQHFSMPTRERPRAKYAP